MYKVRKFKILCLVMAIVFALAMAVTGCGKNTGQGDQTSPAASTVQTTVQATQTTVQTEKELDFVNLEWYMGIPLNPRPNEENVIAEINKELKEKINANVTFNMIDFSTLQQKLNVMIAAGEPFDLVMTGSPFGFSQNVQKGAFLPIDDLLTKYGQHILQKVPQNAWPAVTFSNNRYAIINPMVWSTPLGFTYKKDLMDKYGFDYKNCHTIQDLEPYLAQIKKSEPDITPLCLSQDVNVIANNGLTPSNYGVNDNIVSANSVNLISYNTEQNKLQYWFDDSLMVQDLKTINDYYKKGYIKKGAATIKDFGSSQWKTGKYAVMGTNGVYDETGGKSTTNSGFPCVESFVAQNPIGTNNVQWPVTALGKNSANPERAMMLVDLLFGDKKFFNTVCYGIEGQDYKVVSGQGTDNPTVESNTPQTWAIWHPWIGSLWDQWPSNWNTAEALEKLKNDTDNGKMSPILGFVFNPEPVKTQVAQISALTADLTVLGIGMESDFDKYLADEKEKFMNAGIDKVLAEVQKQLDEWKAINGK